MSRAIALTTLAAVSLFLACGPSKLSVRQMNVASPSLMIAKKSPRTAYLVLDPARVPAHLPVLVNNTDRGGRLEDVQAFVDRDIHRAFSNYFQKVEVVAPGHDFGSEPHVVIEVKLERVEVRSQVLGGVSRGYAAMTWGMGIRLSGDEEYLYTFAGESVGSPTADVNVVFRSMFESAVTDMLKGYTDKQVHAVVLRSDVPAPAPAATNTEL
jgi:hypothetical protein